MSIRKAAPGNRRLLVGGLFFGAWLLFALFASLVSYMHHAIGGEPRPWVNLFAVTAADCSFLAALCLVILWLVRSFPFEPRRWPLAVLAHLGAFLGGALVRAVFLTPFCLFLLPPREKTWGAVDWFKVLLTGHVPGYVLIYCLLLGVALAVEFYRKFRQREQRATQLEAQLAQAQLQVLKMQLHPHFLFNTLNAISALMHQDVELADRMIARLGDLLRATLDNAGTQEVSLREELEFIRPYLEIEQARLGPRLTVRMDIDPETLDARVPNLLLQPLVENAVRHGIAPRAEPGRIEIRAYRNGDALCVEVGDDGPGMTDAVVTEEVFQGTALKKGIGLANTRARLQQLYGPAHRLALANEPGGGLVVTVCVPFREHQEPAREFAAAAGEKVPVS